MEYVERQRRNNLFRSALIAKPTECELIVKDYLESRGIHFMFQKGFLKPFHRIVDFYIPGTKSKRFILEIDGPCHDKSIDADRRKDQSALLDRNIRTLRITNAQVESGEFIEILKPYL